MTAIRAFLILLLAAAAPAANATIYAAIATDSEPPVISLATGPRQPDAPMIVASATDNVGVVAMHLYLNGVLRASSTLGTISYGWAGVNAGTYRIRIVAVDAANNSGSVNAKIVVR
jgi:hypothetical protein